MKLFFVDFFWENFCLDKHHVEKKSTKNNIESRTENTITEVGMRDIAIGAGIFVFILKDVACAQES